MKLTPEASAALARIARVSGVRAEPQALLPADFVAVMAAVVTAAPTR